MNTRQNAVTNPDSHLPILYQLRRINNWAVFGTITFNNPNLRVSKDLKPIHRRIHGLIIALAMKFKVRKRNLVFFYSIEGDGNHRHRHVHILLAHDRLEHVTAEQLCGSLTELASRYRIGDCRFAPFDAQKDGLAYAAKSETVPGNDGRKIAVEAQTYESMAFCKRIHHLNLDTVSNDPNQFYQKTIMNKSKPKNSHRKSSDEAARKKQIAEALRKFEIMLETEPDSPTTGSVERSLHL